MGSIETLVKGALLHDIGKVVYRSGKVSEDAATAGATFLRSYTQQEEIVQCAQYHHKKQLESVNVCDDSFVYLVHEAIQLTSGDDYHEFEEGNPTDIQYFDSTLPLTSVFYTFAGKKSESPRSYELCSFDLMKGMNYPIEAKENTKTDKKNTKIDKKNSKTHKGCPTDESSIASRQAYVDLYNTLKQSFDAKSIDAMTVNELLQTYENSTSYVPVDIRRQKHSDVSLYMHSKLTAAIATSLKLYYDDQGLYNYKEYCFTDAEENRNRQAFMMISADISGIQDFIYTVPSKGALKSLRGRSVYLEILLESVIDSLLEALNLTRCNVIYSGGGHFYILAPNTESAKKVVASTQDSVNTWLLEHVGTKLYIAMGTASCCGRDLRNGKMLHKLFADASRNADNSKMTRYNEVSLQDLFNPNSSLNTVRVGDRECSICHTSSVELQQYGDRRTFACSMCDSLFKLGEGLVQKCDVLLGIAHPHEELEAMYSIPIYDKDQMFLYIIPQVQMEKFRDTVNWKRLYLINATSTGTYVANRLWLADYVARKENTSIYEFSELAKLCGVANVGVERLGVLRADVDNLGAAFINGFINDKSKHTYTFNTFSRYADLSRALSMFFKVGVNQIVAGASGSDINERYHLWDDFGEKKGHIHVIYSGGDDLFLVGPWDELLEVGIDIRNRLQEFSDGKVTISAGLGMFAPSFPIIKMAEITGELESTAKDMPMKDSIALFGFSTMNMGSVPECQHVYTWDDLINSVIQDKFKFFQKVFAISRQGIVEDKERLPFSRTAIYRIMELLEEIANSNSDTIYNARLLYTLARMEPIHGTDTQKKLYQEFVSSMYGWITTKKTAKEALTAFHILVYSLHEK